MRIKLWKGIIRENVFYKMGLSNCINCRDIIAPYITAAFIVPDIYFWLVGRCCIKLGKIKKLLST
jgi:hypothetical protein